MPDGISSFWISIPGRFYIENWGFKTGKNIYFSRSNSLPFEFVMVHPFDRGISTALVIVINIFIFINKINFFIRFIVSWYGVNPRLTQKLKKTKSEQMVKNARIEVTKINLQPHKTNSINVYCTQLTLSWHQWVTIMDEI